MSAEQSASSGETLAALLALGGGQSVDIRRSFLQQRGDGGGAGPLAAFIHSRRASALDLYLLARAVISREPWKLALPSRTWGRAMGLTRPSAPGTVSEAWDWLEERQLIATARSGKLREVRLLREDGSGNPYVHPAEDDERRGDYFQLPHAYWRANYPGRLGLPAKMVLLIALSLPEGFILPEEHGSSWYGVSRDSVGRGLRTLLRLGVLEFRQERKSAPLSPLGYTFERHYRLRPPFGQAQPEDWPRILEMRRMERLGRRTRDSS